MNFIKKATKVAVGAALLLTTASLAAPEEVSSQLSGSWLGTRSWLSEKGLTIEPNYIVEGAVNARGGARPGEALIGKASLGMEQDLETFGWWGGTAHVSAQLIHGTGPSVLVGDFQGVSNLEYDKLPFFGFYEAWLRQDLFEKQVSLVGGLLEINNDFNSTPSSALFLNSSFGIGSELSQAPLESVFGVSTYPLTSLGGELLWRPSRDWEAKLGAFDGLSQIRTPLKKKPSEGGGFVIAEIDHTIPSAIRVGLGLWSFTNRHPTYSDRNRRDSSYGYYGLFEKTWSSQWTTFLRMGFANAQVNQLVSNTAFGVVKQSITNATDQVGVALTIATNGQPYLEENPESKESEYAIEISYRRDLFQGVAIQPDFQYIINPSMGLDTKDVAYLAVRFDISL